MEHSKRQLRHSSTTFDNTSVLNQSVDRSGLYDQSTTPSVSIAVAKQRMPLNVASSFAVIALGMGVNIVLAPYLIRHLGVATFGIVGMASTLPAYVLLITQSISNSLFRHISLEVHGGRPDAANLYFNTAFKALLGLSALLLLPAILVGTFTSRIFCVPVEVQTETSWLIFLVLLGCLVGAIATPFGAVYQLTHRFFMQNILQVTGRLVGLGVLATCFRVLPASPSYVGVYQLVMMTVSGVLLYGFSLRFQSVFRLRWRYFSLGAARDMLRMGGFLFINDLSVLLFMAVSMVVVNRTLGATACGHFTPILLLSSLMMMIGSAVGNVLMPVLYQYVSRGDMVQLRARTFQIMRVLGATLGVPLILLCGFARPLLTLWLGHQFVFLWPLLWMVLLSLHLGGTLFLPLSYVYRGLNRIRFPALMNLGFGLINLSLMYAIFAHTNFGVFGFGISFLVTFGLRGLIMNGLYCDHVMGLPWGTCWKQVMPSILLTPCACLILFFLVSPALPLGMLLLDGTAVACICAVMTFRMLLTPADRELLYQMLPKTLAGSIWRKL